MDLNLDRTLGPRVPVTSPKVPRAGYWPTWAPPMGPMRIRSLPPEPRQRQRAHHSRARPQELAPPPRMTLVCLRRGLTRARRCKRCRCALFSSATAEKGISTNTYCLQRLARLCLPRRPRRVPQRCNGQSFAEGSVSGLVTGTRGPRSMAALK
jgi:hypothetical protein